MAYARAPPHSLQTILWTEPERVAAGTYIAQTWPTFAIDGLFNLGLPAARRYMTDFLSAVAGSYQLTVLRFDFNMDPAGPWAALAIWATRSFLQKMTTYQLQAR